MTLSGMVRWLHILAAIMLVFPQGLLEQSVDRVVCSSEGFVLEEANTEDGESFSALEIEEERLFISLRLPAGMNYSTMQISLEPQSNAVQLECDLMHGCRPPPFAKVCC